MRRLFCRYHNRVHRRRRRGRARRAAGRACRRHCRRNHRRTMAGRARRGSPAWPAGPHPGCSLRPPERQRPQTPPARHLPQTRRWMRPHPTPSAARRRRLRRRRRHPSRRSGRRAAYPGRPAIAHAASRNPGRTKPRRAEVTAAQRHTEGLRAQQHERRGGGLLRATARLFRQLVVCPVVPGPATLVLPVVLPGVRGRRRERRRRWR